MVILYIDIDGEETVIKDQIDLEYFLHEASDNKFLEIEVRPCKPEQSSDDFIDVSEIPKHDFVKILDSFTHETNALHSVLDEEFAKSTFPKKQMESKSNVQKSENEPFVIADQTLVNSDPNLLLSQSNISIDEPIDNHNQQKEHVITIAQLSKPPNENENECEQIECFKKSGKKSKVRTTNQEHKKREKEKQEKTDSKVEKKTAKETKITESSAPKVNANFKKDKASPEQPKVEFKCSNCATESCGNRIMFCMVCSYQLCDLCHAVLVHEHPMLVTPHPVAPSFIQQLQSKYEKLAVQRKFLLQNVKLFSQTNPSDSNINTLSTKNTTVKPELTGQTSDFSINREELVQVLSKGKMTSEEMALYAKQHLNENNEQFLANLEHHVNSLNK